MDRLTGKLEEILDSPMTSPASSPARSAKIEVEKPSPTPQIKTIPLEITRRAEETPVSTHPPRAPSLSQPTTDIFQRPHLPSLSPEEETIDSLRQQCWLLDQVRIYGSIVRKQKAESARIKAETGTAPDPGIWECPFILSEFAVKERERIGLEVEEEKGFLLRKRKELRRLVGGEEDARASETMVKSDAVPNDKLDIKAPLKRKRNTAAKKVGRITAMKKKRKPNWDDEAWPEWKDADDDEEYEPKLVARSKGTAKLKPKAPKRAPALVAVSKAKKNNEKTLPSVPRRQQKQKQKQIQTQKTKRVATKVAGRGKAEARG